LKEEKEEVMLEMDEKEKWKKGGEFEYNEGKRNTRVMRVIPGALGLRVAKEATTVSRHKIPVYLRIINY
jgi:hypothetical protein